MTPARLAALGLSLVVLLAAVWLVFVGVPNTPAPAPSNVAALPSGSGTTPTTPGPGGTAEPVATGSPGTPASPGPDATPTNPLIKDVVGHSADPDQLTGYVWPVKLGLITTRFAPLAATDGGFVMIDGVAYHDGLDLATHCNDTVRATHDGTVLYAGRDYDPYLGYQGNAEAIYDRLKQLGHTNEQPIVVVIDDHDGYRSVYVHLNEADVEAGQEVAAGDKIGLEGATGFATGCHLHFSLIRMDGPWQPVVSRLLQFGYPPLVRERVDPLDVLPWGDRDAPQRLQDKVNPPSPTPIASSSPAPSDEPGASPSSQPSGLPTDPPSTSSPSPSAKPAN